MNFRFNLYRGWYYSANASSSRRLVRMGRKELTLRGTNIVVPSGLWKWDEEDDASVFSVYTQDTHNFALRVEGLHAAVKRILSGNSTGLSPFSAINMASEYGRGFAASTIATGGKSGNLITVGVSFGRGSKRRCPDELSCAFWD